MPCTITLPITEARYAYQYRCVVTDENGNTETSDAVRIVRPAVFEIVTQPVDYVGAIGDMATFTVGAVGEGLTYQWQWSSGSKWYSTTASGNKTDTLTVEITEAHCAYQYRCVVTDANGEQLTSDAARIIGLA